MASEVLVPFLLEILLVICIGVVGFGIRIIIRLNSDVSSVLARVVVLEQSVIAWMGQLIDAVKGKDE